MRSSDDLVYDVAFSFLGDDEHLAVKLNDLLKGRLSTFIYSDAESQTVLAGRDGETVFNRVFGTEARTVVVLYRTGWGDRGFTAIEATAISNRAFVDGYDFVTFIPLDKPPTVPPWLPKNIGPGGEPGWRLKQDLEQNVIQTARLADEVAKDLLKKIIDDRQRRG